MEFAIGLVLIGLFFIFVYDKLLFHFGFSRDDGNNMLIGYFAIDLLYTLAFKSLSQPLSNTLIDVIMSVFFLWYFYTRTPWRS